MNVYLEDEFGRTGRQCSFYTCTWLEPELLPACLRLFQRASRSSKERRPVGMNNIDYRFMHLTSELELSKNACAAADRYLSNESHNLRSNGHAGKGADAPVDW